MLPRVIEAYAQHGYGVRVGNPSALPSSIFPLTDNDKIVATGGGISVSDAFLFLLLSRIYTPKSVFVIGNASGISTFSLADIFPEATIDVIDAETEGSQNTLGSTLTRTIAQSHYPNVRLTIGFSPQDVPKAMSRDKYQLAFIDGLHTNKQMALDFEAVLPWLDEQAVVIFHDVASHHMLSGWKDICTSSEAYAFKAYEMAFTQFGSCVLVRGLPAVSKFMESVSEPFGQHAYVLGHTLAPYPGRPRFWRWSLNMLEHFLRLKLQK